MAKELEKRGSHMIGIKDMSGLVKPMAAGKLITALKNEVAIPIHFHTHDTSGNAVASVLMAAASGVDIADAAISSMSGLTSQPNLNSIFCAFCQPLKASAGHALFEHRGRGAVINGQPQPNLRNL